MVRPVVSSAIDDDAGSATVFLAFAVAILMALTVAGVQLGSAMIARQQAENAADLGALAGAALIFSGEAAACAKAGATVTRGGASLESCRTDGLDLLIEVSVAAGFLGGRAPAKARAGPVGVTVG
ncbi:Rv3654c family TadE-like protein [Nakamurella antarctica]|uniref:Rv3654c family TadE-like protein n=1 Tax=Nakamurella antarctica TaxID=1902245 RepID=UPI0019CFA77C|nr:Rv3654c family TadE-like protein [Nakamurella antarctica]